MVQVKNKLKQRLQGITAEHAMLISMITISGYFYVKAQSFSQNVALFPEIFSAFVFVGSTVLLIRGYLPDAFSVYLTESAGLLSRDNDNELGIEQDDESNRIGSQSDRVSPISSIAVLLIVYTGLSYLIGMTLASPVFVIAYGLWFDLTKKATAGLAILVFLIGIAFQLALGSVAQGALFG